MPEPLEAIPLFTVTLDPGDNSEAATVALIGEIDAAAADAVSSVLLEAAATGRPQIIDLAGVTFIDSSGLNALLRARNVAVGERIDFRLHNAPASMRRMMNLTGLSALLDDEN